MYKLSGKQAADAILHQVQMEIFEHAFHPKLVIIQVGNNPASTRYVRNKCIDAAKCGIETEVVRFYENGVPDKFNEAKATKLQNELHDVISKYSEDSKVNGIIVQLPLPDCINVQEVLDRIPYYKDVDGLSNITIGRLYSGKYSWQKGEVFAPCTAEGVIQLLWHYNIPISGKNALVIGRSNLVGAPLARLLQDNGATVTVAHTKTPAPTLHGLIDSNYFQIICSATGHQNIFKASDCHPGKDITLVDIGITFDENGKMRGEIDIDLPVDEDIICDNNDVPKGLKFTPVPGGIGLMTRALLMRHVLDAAKYDVANRNTNF